MIGRLNLHEVERYFQLPEEKKYFQEIKKHFELLSTSERKGELLSTDVRLAELLVSASGTPTNKKGARVNWRMLQSSFDAMVEAARKDLLIVDHVETFFKQLYPNIVRYAGGYPLLDKWLGRGGESILYKDDGTVEFQDMRYGWGQENCATFPSAAKVKDKTAKLRSCAMSALVRANGHLRRQLDVGGMPWRGTKGEGKDKRVAGTRQMRLLCDHYLGAKTYCAHSESSNRVTCFIGASVYKCDLVLEEDKTPGTKKP